MSDEQDRAETNDDHTTMSKQLPDPEDAPNKCTEYTEETGLDAADMDAEEYYFAFVCPRCEEKNALEGNPRNFSNKPFRCLGCNYVPLLEKDALHEFADRVGM